MAPGPAQEDEPIVEDSLARGRSRRTKQDKTGRFAALEKLKRAKESGEKHKYEFTEEAAVYEEVDETEYSKIVRERQEDDWIVDDDGSGYVEDGREIFDDELDEDNVYTSKAKKAVEQSKKSKNPNIMKPGSKPKATIKSMFQAHTGLKKKPVKEVSLDNDDILGDIMNELNQNSSAPAFKPPPAKMVKKQNGPAKSPYNPFNTKVKSRVSPTQPAKPYPSPLASQRSAPRPVVKKIKQEIKQEVEESPEIDEYDSCPMDYRDDDDDGQENIKVKVEPKENGHHESEMEVGDIDFDDNFGETEEQKPKVKQEVEDSKPVISAEFLASSWDTMQDGADRGTAMTDVTVDSSSLPLITNENGDQVLRMYWLDAYEERSKSGTIYLFGKVWIESAKTHVSCCVCVSNIERQMFFLPRSTRVNLKTGHDTGEEVTFVDVYNEITKELKDKRNITMFKSRKVTKEYCFEVADIPVESEYMEVRYNGAKFPTRIPQELKGETFSHVFGTNTSFLELLLLERKLKGPSWIDIKAPQIIKAPMSWCKVEAEAVSPDNITVVKDASPPPPLVSMTITMRTLPNPKTHQNEVIAVACLVNQQFQMDKPAPKTPFNSHFCAITKPSDNIFPYDFKDWVQRESKNTKVDIQPTERALLAFLLARLHKIDPDLIVGHDIYGFDIDVLLHRLQSNKIPHWSKMGRLKRQMMPKLSGGPGRGFSLASQSAMCGRIVCDVKVSAKELIRSRAYDLTELSNQVLKERRQEIDLDDMRDMYSSSKHLMELVKLTLIDATFVLRIMYELNVLPLALQITNICGNVMSRTLMGGRAERNEHLLLHAFTEKNYIAPDKQYGKKHVANEENADDDDDHNQSKPSKKTQGRRKPAYAGGLVLEPKKGFYDKYILLLDFNSLYPSIIQEYNICFTTIARTPDKTKQEGEEEEDWHLELPDQDLEPGILPTEIRKLVESRKQVKQMMKAPNLSPDAYMQYDIRQKALKLTANSMYGCLGFSHSRFYAKPLAALVTGKGREILMKTKDLVESMNLEVIYGDTDSIMIHTNSTEMEEVFKLGNKVKSEVNKLYRLLEIDIDGVFKSMLLLKKKKYAALTVSKVGDKYVTSQELKGLDIVRRDWCELAKSAGNFVVSQILSGEQRETIVENIHSKLIEVGEEVAQGKIPAEMFYITKQLTKNPTDYPDKKSLPHVQVALRLNSKGGRQLKGGDTVYYVICEDGSSLPASQRAYHPDELAKSDTLKIDNKYYLSSQVHPVVSRLCDPIEGTDAAHIAECLGLDPTGYKHAISRNEDRDDEAMLSVALSEAEKYKDCDPLKVSCPACEREIIFDNVFTVLEPMFECSLSKCPNPQCTNNPSCFVPLIQNKLTLAIRGHLQKYYQGWMKCEDSACSARTRRLPLVFQRGHPMCQACHRGTLHPEYTESALYHQLCYYRFMFDLPKAIQNVSKKHQDLAKRYTNPYEDSYLTLKTFVDKKLRVSAYSQVSLATLFDGLGLLSLK